MPSIDNTAQKLIKGQFKSADGKIWASAIAKIYKCPAGSASWSPLTKAGALLFLRDSRRNDNAYLRLVDVDGVAETDGKIPIWEHELFVGFDFRKDAPYFFSFESDICQYGVLFCDVKEATEFSKYILKKSAKIGRGMSLGDCDTVSVSSVGSSRSRRSSFLGSIFSSSSGGSKDAKEEPQKSKSKVLDKVNEDDIGDPIGFQHLSHIGFNPHSGVWDMQNIPPKWKRFFEAAGVGKEQLESKENAGFIAEFVQTVQREEAAVKKKGPPPPPPPKKKSAPPPPRQPPTRTETSEPVKLSKPTTAPPKPALTQPKASVATPKSSAPPPPSFADFKAFQQEQHHTPEPEDRPAAPKRPPPALAGPSLNDQLLQSIRAAAGTNLRPTPKQDPATTSSPALDDDAPGDAMAALLAKALKNRNRAMAGSDSEEEW